MEKPRTARSPWRSWTAIALVLVTLALVQACGDSGKSTGPTPNAALQLKLRRVNGAEIPSGCTGKYSVSGPGVNISNAALPESGRISFQGQIGQTYLVSVELTCGQLLVTKQGTGGTLTGSTLVTVQPGGNVATIVLTYSQVLDVKCKSPVDPGETSNCECKVQSPGSANIGWTGANPSGPATATFSNQNPGTYAVSCTVNGIDTKSTTVTVNSPPPPPPPVLGTLQVTNTAEDCSFCDVDVTFSPSTVAPIVGLGAGQTVQRNNLAPGSYVAMTNCSGNIPFQIQAGQTTPLQVNGFDCG